MIRIVVALFAFLVVPAAALDRAPSAQSLGPGSTLFGPLGCAPGKTCDASSLGAAPSANASPGSLALLIWQLQTMGLPDYSAAVLGGVVANDGTPQSDRIMLALSKIPASGGHLRLPCGKMVLDKTLVIPNPRVRVSSATHYCSHLSSASSFTDGDVVRITPTGVYSGLSDIAIDHIDQEGGAARTSGYTINLDSGYNYVENATLRHCFVCIRMGTAGGWSKVDTVAMQSMQDGTLYPGSGGILVENGTVGAENWITHVLVMSNFLDPVAANHRYPSYGVKLTKSGAAIITDSDFISLLTNILVAPGGAANDPDAISHRVEATRINSSYMDSAQNTNIALIPYGDGYIFDFRVSNSWLTNTGPQNTTGILLDTSQSTPTSNITTPIRGVGWSGGLIVSTTGQTGSGIACNGSKPVDLIVTGAIIAGWGVGADFGAGCSHVTLSDNSIGAYSPFNVASGLKSNVIGIRFQAGAGDWLIAHDNRLFGNASEALVNAATGANNRFHDNPGYNPVGASQITVPASPATVGPLPTTATYYVSGGSAVTVKQGAIGGGTLTLCAAAPCTFTVPAGATASVAYTTAPTIVQTIH